MTATHYKKRKSAWLFTKTLFTFVIYFTAFFMVAISCWIASHFGKPPLEQVLYHAQFGRSGLVDTDLTLLKSFVLLCGALPFTLALLLSIYHQNIVSLIHKTIKNSQILKPLIVPKTFKALFFIKLLKPIKYLRLPGTVFLLCATYFSIQFSITAYIAQKFGPDYFAQNYLNPKEVNMSYAKPKNLIIIYVESLEKSYQNADLFGRNLLAKLDTIEGFSFEAFSQAPGTGWTIAGLTATQCGVPLKNVSLYDGNDQGENIKSFLPSAVCLGDILNRAGYYNVYMGGASSNFSGKGKFFNDHHYDEVLGREELMSALNVTDTNYWGLYDDDLLIAVKDKIKHLHAQKKPFNLSFVTVDTHGPDGHFSHYCTKNGALDFADIIECTAEQVHQLVDFIKTNGYLKDTNVVILGDHLAMYNPLNKALESLDKRFIYNKFISEDVFTKNRENLLHFDFFPTLLEFIGFEIEGGKLGLGYTGLKDMDSLPGLEQLDDMNKSLLNHSDEYLNLWAK
jgi:phosphoglycerol transferase